MAVHPTCLCCDKCDHELVSTQDGGRPSTGAVRPCSNCGEPVGSSSLTVSLERIKAAKVPQASITKRLGRV